jgi:hypothetical protein
VSPIDGAETECAARVMNPCGKGVVISGNDVVIRKYGRDGAVQGGNFSRGDVGTYQHYLLFDVFIY